MVRNPIYKVVLEKNLKIRSFVCVSPPSVEDAQLHHEESNLMQAILRLEDRFESVLLEPRLDNFDGLVCIAVLDEGDSFLNAEEAESGQKYFLAQGGQRCHLRVQLLPPDVHDESEWHLCRQLKIVNGRIVDRVAFDIDLDSLTVDLGEDHLSCTVSVGSPSPLLIVGFTAPSCSGEHRLFVEVSQNNRLLQSVPIVLRVM